MKAQPASLAAAETYLRNRQWVVGSAVNLREALAYIIQKNPQYVFITADHPNKKVRVLPKMLTQAFPVRVIGFAERGTGISTKNLHEMALEYNLYPPVSGPAIQRMVLKIKKDDELKAQAAELEKASKSSEGTAASNETITFKGETASGDSMKTSFEQARAALTQLINSDGAANEDSGPGIATTGSASQSNSSAAGSYVPGSSDSSTGSSMINFQTDGSGQNSNPAPGMYNPQNRNSSSGFESNRESGPAYFNPQTPGANNAIGYNPNDPSSFHDGQSNWNSALAQPFNPMEGSTQNPATNGGIEGHLSGPNARGANGSNVPIMESEYVPKASAKPYRISREKEPNQKTAQQSLFIRGAQTALNEAANQKGAQAPAVTSNATNLACITVESPRFSGYLVCAMGKNRQMDKAFVGLIQNRLFKFLKDNGEDIKEQDTMNLKIQPVDFTAWTLEQAEFLKKSVHDGDEIAIAFFPTQIKQEELKRSASEKMVMIHLHELQDDVAVEFDLYIYMPQNNKYLLYTPQGRPLYGQQKDRLKEKGITHMHLRREAEPDVKKYRAQNFLNEKINAYKKPTGKPGN